MKQMAIKIFLLFYFVASFQSATHIHVQKKHATQDCKVCFIAKTLQVSDTTNKNTLHISLENYFQEYLYIKKLHLQKQFKGYNATAPPPQALFI
jgi:hypothetical protein